MLKKKILINCTMGNVLRFLPPLIVTKEEIDHVIQTLEEVFEEIIYSPE
jgi:acetylornithine/succinyldiaminopimelate/putrescine aminotransferase